MRELVRLHVFTHVCMPRSLLAGEEDPDYFKVEYFMEMFEEVELV